MINQVTIVATYYGKEFSGTFPLVSINNGDRYCSRDKYVTIVKDGKTITVQAYEKDIQVKGSIGLSFSTTAPQVDQTDEELSELIRSRFSIMNRMGDSLVNGNVRALIVSGAPGVGKTFELEAKIMQAEFDGKAEKVTHVKGRLTGLALMAMLYHHRQKNQILLLDDVDSVFDNETDMNLLKGALDTSKRIVGWNTASPWLADNGIEQQFEFEGSIVFITNKNFDAIIERGGNMAEHMKALISRSNYLDLKCHTAREVLIRVRHLIEDTNILGDNNLTAAQGEEVMQFLKDNLNSLREVSVRTLIKIAQYINEDPVGWMDIAKVMCCK